MVDTVEVQEGAQVEVMVEAETAGMEKGAI